MPIDPLAPLTTLAVQWLPWMLPATFALGGLNLLASGARARRRGADGEARVGRALKRLFPAVAHDLILPNGHGGLTQIDHVALTPTGLLVVETKNYQGHIRGRAEDRTWQQALGRERHRFQNPLHQNAGHLRAVRRACPQTSVLGRVVFCDTARFPQGRPEGVSQLRTLRRDLKALRAGTPAPALAQAWATLLATARTDPAAKAAHLHALQARFGPDPRTRTATILLVLALVAALGLFVFR